MFSIAQIIFQYLWSFPELNVLDKPAGEMQFLDQKKNLQNILETEYFNKNLSNILLAKVLVDKNSPFLKSVIINKNNLKIESENFKYLF